MVAWGYCWGGGVGERDGDGCEGGNIQGQKETFEGDRLIHYLDCSNRFTVTQVMSNLIKLYTLNRYSLWYVTYTSINLLKCIYQASDYIPHIMHEYISVWLCQVDLIRNSIFLYLLLWYELNFKVFLSSYSYSWPYTGTVRVTSKYV